MSFGLCGDEPEIFVITPANLASKLRLLLGNDDYENFEPSLVINLASSTSFHNIPKLRQLNINSDDKFHRAHGCKVVFADFTEINILYVIALFDKNDRASLSREHRDRAVSIVRLLETATSEAHIRGIIRQLALVVDNS